MSNCEKSHVNSNIEEDHDDSAGFIKKVHTMWCHFTDSLHNVICHGLVTMSVLAARNAKVTIVSIPILSLLLVGVGYFANFTLVVDQYEAFAPQNSPSEHQRLWIMNSGFPSDRSPIYLIVHSDNNEQTSSITTNANSPDNLLGQEGIRRVFEAINAVRETPKYDEVCEHSDYVEPWSRETSCQIVSVTRFWDHNKVFFESAVQSDQDVIDTLSALEYPNGSPVDLSLIANLTENVTADSDSGEEVRVVESVEAYLTAIYLPQTQGVEELEKNALNRIFQLRQEWENNADSNIKIEVYSHRTFSDEYLRAIFNDLPLLPVVCFVMTMFTCIIFFRKNPIQSRTFLGIASIATITLSIMSGFGLMFLLGVPYTNSTTILPFIIYGVGLDDTFIITGHYLRSSNSERKHNKDPIERLATTITTVGMSIFVTTLTTSLAFLFGLNTSIPSIYWICVYAAPTIIIDFIYQITFFTAIMILDERRVLSHKKDYIYRLPCAPNNAETAKTDEISIDENSEISCSKDRINKAEISKELSISSSTEDEDNYNDRQIAVESATQSVLVNSDATSGEDEENKSVSNTVDTMTSESDDSSCSRSVPDRFMEWYSEQLMRKWVKVVVIISFVAYFAGCFYSMTLLTQKFSWEDVVPNDSYALSFLQMKEKHSKRLTYSSVYFRGVDQSDPEIQGQMIDYINDLSSLDNFEEPPFCWVRDYQRIINDSRYKPFLQNMTFNQQMETMLSIPAFKEVYGRDIKRNETTGEIISSRCLLYIYDLDLDVVEDTVHFLHEQQRVGREQPINSNNLDMKTEDAGDWSFFVYDDFFLMFEFYAVHISELRSTTIQAIAAVTVVGFVFLPHWSAMFFILPLMVVLYVDLLGTIQFCGVYMNVVTYVALVISIGLLVDFIMHILIRYYESPQSTREGKVKDTLKSLGSSILVGGISTFLGVLPLMLSTSYVLTTICICFFAMIVLGVSHGLILLPVLLSIFGPINDNSNNTATLAIIEDAKQQQQHLQDNDEQEQQSVAEQQICEVITNDTLICAINSGDSSPKSATSNV